MFGPNQRSWHVQETGRDAGIHHRESAYADLLRELVDRFKHVFSVPEDHTVLVLSGSGTLANEAVIYSSLYPLSVPKTARIHEFSGRLMRQAQAHKKWTVKGASKKFLSMWAQYETATSTKLGGSPDFGDFVSSFPYFDVPEGCKIWTTVSSKQLGALPVISFVVVSPEGWDLLERYGGYSLLSLSRYRESFPYSPHTPSLPLIHDCIETLDNFTVAALRARVDARRRLLLDAVCFSLDKKADDVALHVGPVLTFRPDVLPRVLVESSNLYCSSFGPQVFLYSGSDSEYESFAKELANVGASSV